MLKRVVHGILMSGLLGSIALAAQAETSHQLGVSSYAMDIDLSIPEVFVPNVGTIDLSTTIESSGASLAYTVSGSDAAAFRFAYYNLDVDEIADIEVNAGEIKGFDLQILLGAGLNSTGFKVYIAPGFFSESVSFDAEEEDFRGLQIGLGFGYNWEVVSVEAWGNWRQGKEYEDFLNSFLPAGFDEKIEVDVVSMGISISARF